MGAMRTNYKPRWQLLLAFLVALHCKCEGKVLSALYTHDGNLQSGFCENRAVNYLTQSLPQQCLKTSWPGGGVLEQPVEAERPISQISNDKSKMPAASQITPPASLEVDGEARIEAPTPTAEGDAGTRTFMSFEDWKELMLLRAGQDPHELRSRKAADYHVDPERFGHESGGLDSLGDEGEISLNFDTYSDKISSIGNHAHQTNADSSSQDRQPEAVLYDDGRTQYYRSNDAGKTCKERFSYSSFDAGATVLKTNQGAKNSKAILVENKDSYMLLECAADNKFVIVELTDDILVDTIVLANFEFFSSMIRQFRVSVSDRYPVKVDKWKELGIFEAKNSRDIQPFLVENPLIWAKYVRIEFLTHYGNEYYCPVSLLRVHGTRMLESWKETEAAPEEDEPDDDKGSTDGPVYALSDTPSNVSLESELSLHVNGSDKEPGVDPSPDLMTSELPLLPLDFMTSTCMAPPADMSQSISSSQSLDSQEKSIDAADRVPHGGSQRRSGGSDGRPADLNISTTSSIADTSTLSTTRSRILSPVPVETTGHNSTQQPLSTLSTEESRDPGSGSVTRATTAVISRNKTSSTASASPASPTIQESFFKAITKRLQLLESNVTLSLKYMEDQSRFLQEGQQAAEKKQLSRVDTFLDTLNRTVLSELQNVRQQYDQIWQSTIIALESQREQSRRESVALSSRLNILAEEVVFQKRMAIVQAILLLSCLVLVIFSRNIVHPILPSHFESDIASATTHIRPWSSEQSSRGVYGHEAVAIGSTPGRPVDAQYRRFPSQAQIASLSMEDSPTPTPPSSVGQRYRRDEYGLDLGSMVTSNLDQLPVTPDFDDQFHITTGTSASAVQAVSEVDILPTDQRPSSCVSPPTPSSDTDMQDTPHDEGEIRPQSVYRRLNSSQAVNPRKPLPALPEYPT